MFLTKGDGVLPLPLFYLENDMSNAYSQYGFINRHVAQNRPEVYNDVCDFSKGDRFIGVYKNILSPEFCKNLIETYEHYNNTTPDDALGREVEDPRGFRCDDLYIEQIPEFIEASGTLFHFLWEHYNKYEKTFDILSWSPKLIAMPLKMRKVSKENKESNWEYHYEQQSDDIQSQGRILTFMYYLNDIEEGGETEFVYQDRLKIKPTTGTLLIWPAGFTHTHRALPILNDEPKYLITGWIMFDKLFDNYFGEKKEYIEKLNKENA